MVGKIPPNSITPPSILENGIFSLVIDCQIDKDKNIIEEEKRPFILVELISPTDENNSVLKNTIKKFKQNVISDNLISESVGMRMPETNIYNWIVISKMTGLPGNIKGIIVRHIDPAENIDKIISSYKFFPLKGSQENQPQKSHK